MPRQPDTLPREDGVGAACFCMGFLSDEHGMDATILRGDFRSQDIHWPSQRLVTLCSGCSDGHVLDAHEWQGEREVPVDSWTVSIIACLRFLTWTSRLCFSHLRESSVATWSDSITGCVRSVKRCTLSDEAQVAQ
jgi:hypothetical protein